MKWRVFLVLLVAFWCNCPKRPGPTTRTINLRYLGALDADLARTEPYLAAKADTGAVVVGVLEFEEPFLYEVWRRLGFFSLLDDLEVDFLVTGAPALGNRFYTVTSDMGYGIQNYRGIRFGLLSQVRDTLTISEQTRITVLRQRCDVLWVLDRALRETGPSEITIRIAERAVADTALRPLRSVSDSLTQAKVLAFKSALDGELGRSIDLGGIGLRDYVLSSLARQTGANVILYPRAVFRGTAASDPLSFHELIASVDLAERFEVKEADKTEVARLSQERSYETWGKVAAQNRVLIPDPGGDMLYDLIFP